MTLPAQYRDAPAWAFGDSPEQADELLDLVLQGIKTATCSARSASGPEEVLAEPGSVVAYWRAEHEAFFRRTGEFTPDMELVCERFELLERLPQADITLT